jgi:hypothetical protein
MRSSKLSLVRWSSLVPVFCLGLATAALPREAAAQAWLAESFNNNPGSCFAGDVPIDGFGFTRSLNLSPSPESGTSVSALCDVPDQPFGMHVLEFDVFVAAANNPSTAKLELKTVGGGIQDKKFQIFFGDGMRVNYFFNSMTTELLPAGGASFGWHHFRCEVDLNSSLFNIYIDGVPRAFFLPMQPGPITAVGVTGFQFAGRPGIVRLDNTLGYR